MRVVLVPRDIDGSGCYRVLLPARELRLRRGWDAQMPPSSDWMVGRHRHLVFNDLSGFLRECPPDVLWWQPRTEWWTPGVAAWLRARGVRVVVDVDDAWWGLPEWNPGSTRSSADLKVMRANLRAADGVSVATPALAELYRPYNRNVRVIRNRLDWHMWEDVVPVYEVRRRRVRVGWMGDSKWRRGDLDVLKPWLSGWLQAHRGVEFVAAGDPSVHDYLGVPHEQRVSTNNVEFYNFDLADITATFDIGLVPLDLSTPEARRLNECKSHLKGLEYAACGIPCVATPTESYRWWARKQHERFRHCLLASTPVEWMNHLDSMLDWRRETAYQFMGLAARAVAQEHTLQADISGWEDWVAGNGSDSEHTRTRTPAAGSMVVR